MIFQNNYHHDIPYQQCGKLLVASNQQEYERMKTLYQRCQENELQAIWLDQAQLKEKEPHIVGLGAILVSTTGIVDYRLVCQKMAMVFEQLGGEIALNSEVIALSETTEQVAVSTQQRGVKKAFPVIF